MLKENKILNGSLKPPQGSRRTFFQKPGQWTRWAAFDWNEKYEESFYSFHIHAGLLHGPSFNLSKSSSGSVFSHLKEHILLKKKREKSVPFSITPIYFTFSLLPGSASLRERKQPEVGGGVAFQWRFGPPPSLIRPGLHFYAWNTEVDWKHSVAIQTLKKRDPLSFIRYEDLQ